MRLVSFSVEKYRSITNESVIPLDNYSVLVGKNNEGKTNILRALHMTLDALGMLSYGDRGVSVRGRSRFLDYDWRRDYPVELQHEEKDGHSKFGIVFELSAEEASYLQDDLGFGVAKRTRVELAVSQNEATFKVFYEPGGVPVGDERALRLMRRMSVFLSNVYIPAVRTKSTAMDALERTIEQRMRVLERNPDYVKALDTVERLRKQELDLISEQLKEPLKVFLPNVRSVELDGDGFRRRYRPFGPYNSSAYEVYVDDGVRTAIGQKGDGIQSLMALAILRGSERGTASTVLAVEEPESHLHPGAIRELQVVLRHIADEQGQVIVTTHNPLFVRRDNVSSNIIVENGGAHRAGNLAEIRKALGVSSSDNLVSAEMVILVEGMADRVLLEKVLPYGRPNVAEALASGTVAIKEMGGINNLCYELIHLQGELRNFVVLCDNDAEARNSVGKACERRLIQNRLEQVVLASRVDCQTELEDFLRPEFYAPIVGNELQIALDDSEDGRTNYGILVYGKKKWSDRIRSLCEHKNVFLDESLLMHLKTLVSEAVRLFDGRVEDMLCDDATFVDRLVHVAFETPAA